MTYFTFPNAPLLPEAEKLRGEVRAFLAEELRHVPAHVRAASWSGFDAKFSRRMGERGWIGMTWPRQYGGHERSSLERYVVLEEMLAAGAPVAAHWIADRQSGPLLLRFGTEEQRRSVLPKIAAGELFCCIGMSEPDSGSDLAAVRTRAEPVDGGFRVNGTKLWTTYGHRAHVMLLFCRTSGGPADRHKGTSQLLVDLTLPGITIRPIADLSGAKHFNEVVFENVFVPASALIGEEGNGWHQVTSELAYERSGPERFLSSFVLFAELIRVLQRNPSEHATVAVGRLISHFVVLRQLSRGVAWLLQNGENPALEAAVVKDLGALVEQEMPDVVRSLVEIEPDAEHTRELIRTLRYIVLAAPSFSLRGGTREILRGIIARGLGLR
ncbi:MULTISPECIES: acyl-CoA dehydrogenase family protein [Bradyrhizobium]|uniref:Acyl-CoA dehydrogenase n=1 Tax=Bradyrhizobium elkanii TaxID=29448 RepID=A0A4U6S528_BRAEL|nr:MULTISPECIES: acyl-CoA dehydrogenase family protein [Bradyrhizobium]MTV12512.1 acyl-CoA dehydrogenase [Bradyrhizobium sp. BR2003]TKV82221.1 acyl-CoA dehydrogenase [Bradyrhizobium elkanii]